MRSFVKMLQDAALLAIIIAAAAAFAFIGGVSFTSGVKLAMKNHGVQVVLIKSQDK